MELVLYPPISGCALESGVPNRELELVVDGQHRGLVTDHLDLAEGLDTYQCPTRNCKLIMLQ